MQQTQTLDGLIVDAYVGDGPKNWRALAAAGPPWHGAILKATQGTYYNAYPWFDSNWREVKDAGGERYGVDWFRGAYHYLDARLDGSAQADYFLATLGRAGGWGHGDLWPMVDVERAAQRAGMTADRVVETVTCFARRVRGQTGRDVMLYGGSWLAELGIASRMGCARLAVARYMPTLPSYVYERIGWDRAHLALWQYCGDGRASLAGYPAEAPGCGKVDISALVLPGGIDALRAAIAPSDRRPGRAPPPQVRRA